jgi:hypothetical protein
MHILLVFISVSHFIDREFNLDFTLVCMKAIYFLVVSNWKSYAINDLSRNLLRLLPCEVFIYVFASARAFRRSICQVLIYAH